MKVKARKDENREGRRGKKGILPSLGNEKIVTKQTTGELVTKGEEAPEKKRLGTSLENLHGKN